MLFSDRQTCRRETTGDQVIKSVMSGCFARRCLTDKAVDSIGIHSGATMTLMWNIQTEPQTNRHSQLRYLASNRTKQWAVQKASLRCVDDKPRERRLDYKESSVRLQLAPYQPTLLDDPRRAVSSAALLLLLLLLLLLSIPCSAVSIRSEYLLRS